MCLIKDVTEYKLIMLHCAKDSLNTNSAETQETPSQQINTPAKCSGAAVEAISWNKTTTENVGRRREKEMILIKLRRRGSNKERNPVNLLSQM